MALGSGEGGNQTEREAEGGEREDCDGEEDEAARDVRKASWETKRQRRSGKAQARRMRKAAVAGGGGR